MEKIYCYLVFHHTYSNSRGISWGIEHFSVQAAFGLSLFWSLFHDWMFTLVNFLTFCQLEREVMIRKKSNLNCTTYYLTYFFFLLTEEEGEVSRRHNHLTSVRAHKAREVVELEARALQRHLPGPDHMELIKMPDRMGCPSRHLMPVYMPGIVITRRSVHTQILYGVHLVRFTLYSIL